LYLILTFYFYFIDLAVHNNTFYLLLLFFFFRGLLNSNEKRQQGHPLKSFSVPAPPPQSAPSTPQQKHIGNYILY